MNTFKEYLQEGINDKGIFKAIFLGGTPGAGKSFVANKIKSGQIEPRIVNIDKFVEFLTKKFKLPPEIAADTVFRDKTKKLTKTQLVQNINGMLPLIIDGTSSKINNILVRKGILEGFGYDVGMVWIDTSLETSLRRVKDRVKDIQRDVPDDFVKEVFLLSAKNKEFFKNQFNPFLEIKNDDGELTDKIIQSAFKLSSSFFNGDIKNPIGQRTKEGLIKTKEKLLSPSFNDIKEIKTKVDIWFRK